MRRAILPLILLLFVIQTVAVPGEDEIKKKQTQLQKLRKDIDGYESKIKERKKKEHATLDLLDTYDRQALLLRKLIDKLHDQEVLLRHDIDATRESISGLNTLLGSTDQLLVKRPWSAPVQEVHALVDAQIDHLFRRALTLIIVFFALLLLYRIASIKWLTHAKSA